MMHMMFSKKILKYCRALLLIGFCSINLQASQLGSYELMKTSAYAALVSGVVWGGCSAKIFWIRSAAYANEHTTATKQLVRGLVRPYQQKRDIAKGICILSSGILVSCTLACSRE